MLLLSIALALVPTVVWCLIVSWVRPPKLSLRWLLGGIIVGVLLGGPVWLVESAVDGLASPSDRLSRDFLQQVIGAACSEESLKFIGVGLLIWLAYRRGEREVRALVAIAISVGIGFMTLENLVAVIASDTPMSLAMDRQLTILAGHGSYQTIMGIFLAISIRHHRFGWVIAAIIAPVLLHGWGDLAEQLFIDEPDPGSVDDTILYNTWIASIVATALSTVFALWWVLRPVGGQQTPNNHKDPTVR
jgi:RsiW-degrading membrane proteinase PrsW (M82 family)